MNARDPQTLGGRIQKARAAQKLKQDAIANATGVSVQTVSQWELDRVTPRPQRLPTIASTLHVPVEWLLEVYEQPSVKGTARLPLSSLEGPFRLPVISRVQAGEWTATEDPYPVGEGQEVLVTDKRVSASAFALEVDGDSMWPDFRQGDRVVIDPEVEPRPGDFVVAKLDNEGEATFKKYRPRGLAKDGSPIFELVPLNDDWPVVTVDKSNPARIIGTMVEHRRYRR